MKTVARHQAQPAANESAAAPASAPGMYPAVRMRRNRKTDWSRRLVAENVLTTNDLIWPLTAISDQNNFTIQVGLTTFQGTRRTQWAELMAGNVVATMPLIVGFLLAQRQFVATMTFSGLKG